MKAMHFVKRTVFEIDTRRLVLTQGDYTLLECDAIVYYARHDLKLGSGFGGAISVRGGPSIQKELDNIKTPLETCDVVVTGAGNLNAKFIIHAVGPRFFEPETEEKLRRTMRNCLMCSLERGFAEVVFPAMGAGFYKVPLDLCANVMLSEISAHLRAHKKPETVVVCLNDSREFEAFVTASKRLGLCKENEIQTEVQSKAIISKELQ